MVCHFLFEHKQCRCRFLAGDDKEAEQRRNSMFKLIPSVVKGSWVIKQAVGNTPVLLGKKLTTKYFRSASYMPDMNLLEKTSRQMQIWCRQTSLLYMAQPMLMTFGSHASCGH